MDLNVGLTEHFRVDFMVQLMIYYMLSVISHFVTLKEEKWWEENDYFFLQQFVFWTIATFRSSDFLLSSKNIFYSYFFM